uniref:Carboxypeptidase n=1 Tax=Meloidogyne javanica TaxID=6303 RepID=A0A915LCD5_MELJA
MIAENKLDQNIIEKEGIEKAFNVFRYDIKFDIGIYEEIISNKQVKIGEEMVGVYDWLSKQKYSFGIAEVNNIVGALAVFEALGIENTFDVSAVPFIQGYFQYFEIDAPLYNIPDFSSAMPGDWLNNGEFPASEKIIPIGGLLVEQNKILIEEKVKAEDNEAIYAGVPLICIPNNADQFYNSSLVEHLGIGIYVKLKISDENEVDSEVFGVDFQNALNKMIIDDNIYQKTVDELRTKILLDLKENGPKKNIFLKKISEVIGYLNAGNGNLFHYIFAESQGNPKTDPLLNGGPGCSSLGGLFNELGPYLLNKDGKTLRQNPYSWNKYASIIFLESPAWVGFSYNTKVKNVTTGDEEVAVANYAALKDFFNKYPSFKTNPFYLTGESYAGVYIPMLGVKILEGIKDSKINLKGVAIGNGLVSDFINTNTQILYLYNHDSCDIYNIPDNSTCGDMQQNLYTGYNNELVNPYDLYDDCGTEISY